MRELWTGGIEFQASWWDDDPPLDPGYSDTITVDWRNWDGRDGDILDLWSHGEDDVMDTVDDALGRRGWRIVGEPDAERATLAAGLSSAEDMHRKIYVACTRANRRTIEVLP